MTAIGKVAFRECTHLKRITIPEGIKKIETQTFLFCSRLETANLPSTLEEIGYQAFEVCENMTYLKLPRKVTRFGDACFGACYKLELHLPKYTLMPTDVYYGNVFHKELNIVRYE